MSSIPADSPADVTPPATPWQADLAIAGKQKATLRILSVTQVIGSFGMGASPSVGILLTEQIVHSETLAGIARTSLTLGAALLGIPLAILAMRSGRRVALSLGWLIAAIGAATLIMAAVSDSAALLVGGMLMMGAGSAVGLQTRFASTDLALPTRRGRTLSLIVWSGTLGAVIGPNLGVPGEVIAGWLHLPPLSGAFVIAVVMLVSAAVVVFVFLRPDPLLIAQSEIGDSALLNTKARRKASSFRQVIPAIWAIPHARFALVAIVVSHVSMVSLMTMTPIHMDNHGATLSFIGLTISVHVLGMLALSPLVGYASDKIGPVAVILIGQGIFVVGGIVSVLWGAYSDNVMVSLFLLGLGWSCGTVPGSILLSESVPADIRTPAQGVVDTSMNGIAALAALLSGPAFSVIGFGGLSSIAIGLSLPVFALASLLPRGRRDPASVLPSPKQRTAMPELTLDEAGALAPLDTAEAARARVAAGAVLIDTRGAGGREISGEIEGAIPVDRHNLAEEFEFASRTRHKAVLSYDTPIVVVCGSVRGSGPVAAELKERGFTNVTHVEGGFDAYTDADAAEFLELESETGLTPPA
jgi:MFS family permease